MVFFFFSDLSSTFQFFFFVLKKKFKISIINQWELQNPPIMDVSEESLLYRSSLIGKILFIKQTSDKIRWSLWSVSSDGLGLWKKMEKHHHSFYMRIWHKSTRFDNANLNPTPMRRFRNTNSFNSLRRKELARHSRTNSSADNREALRNARSGDFPSDVEIVEPHASNLARSARVKEAGQGESDRPNNGLPAQFLSFLGKDDFRPSYHDRSHSWPVGYRSNWHDKVSRSFFVCV
ncbi:hypothetical protein MKX03_006353, partial [Papaver bracteatum]